MITIINIKKAAGNIFMLLLAAFSLYSCRIYSNYERPSNLPTTGLYRDTTSVTGILVSDTLNFGNTPWRQVFTDVNLQALIEKALTKNTDLLNAQENIEQAQAALKSAKLAYLPSLSLNAQGTLSSFDGGKAVKTYSVPLVLRGKQICSEAFAMLKNKQSLYLCKAVPINNLYKHRL